MKLSQTGKTLAAGEGGPGVLAAAARERTELAAEGLPGRERRGARQLSLRLPRAQRRPPRDQQI